MSTSDEPEKVDLKSLDVTEDKRRELLRLFPEVRTESGKIDFDRLKLVLGEIVDVGKERYGMNWPGKADCFRAIQAPSMATLRPRKDESINWDTAENLIIEGDNLEVLKLLQKAYLGRVKMIYIDPPYNTGHDFIYPDNYSESLRTYLEYTGQVDAAGKKFGTNPDTDGRFHSKWLNMMYPRLSLARNLLRDDGSIFISINDVEVDNLRKLCNDVFGEENFVATIVWQKSKKGDATLIASTHEYVVVFARNKVSLIQKGKWRLKKPGADQVLAYYAQVRRETGSNHELISERMGEYYDALPKGDPRRNHRHYRWSDDTGLYFADNFAGPDDGRESRPRYDIFHPSTGKPCKKPSTGWRWKEERTKAALAAKPPLIHFGPDENTIPCRKSYLAKIIDEPFTSVFYRDGRAGTLELERLLGPGLIEFPKDKHVLKDFIRLATGPQDIVLDFFAGGGTTAQSIIESNCSDNSNRKFILVQLPEPMDREGYKTLAELTRRRVSRVIELSRDDASRPLLNTEHQQYVGFRALELSDSSFRPWDGGSVTSIEMEAQLALHVDHVRRDRSPDDLLFEILLKEGYPPTTRTEARTAASKDVCSAAEGMLLVCLERDLTLDAIRAMADMAPQRVVCLDEGFAGNDQLKANAVQIFKSKGIVFRTV